MQIMLGIFLRSSASDNREHPLVGTAVRNYAALLGEMGRTPAQVVAQLNNLARRHGMSLGSAALAEAVSQAQGAQMSRPDAGLGRCRAALGCLLKKAGAFLGIDKEARRGERRDG